MTVASDYRGGFVDCVIIGLGCYVYGVMNVSLLCCFGMVSFVQGTLSLVLFLDRVRLFLRPWLLPVTLHSWKGFFEAIIYDATQISFIAGPMLMLCAAYLTWVIYQDYIMQDDYLFNAFPLAMERTPLAPQMPPPFSGKGKKLGDP